MSDGVLATRTIILCGTTDGVVFRPPRGRQLALGGVEAIFQPWRFREALVGPAIREDDSDRRYLQPGQPVVMKADRLGVIRNEITT